jgi:hypothetical protein
MPAAGMQAITRVAGARRNTAHDAHCRRARTECAYIQGERIEWLRHEVGTATYLNRARRQRQPACRRPPQREYAMSGSDRARRFMFPSIYRVVQCAVQPDLAQQAAVRRTRAQTAQRPRRGDGD